MRFKIVPKRDWSGKGFWIKGAWVRTGWVVTDGCCNVMPGATWFYTLADAVCAVAVYKAVDGDAQRWWRMWRRVHPC